MQDATAQSWPTSTRCKREETERPALNWTGGVFLDKKSPAYLGGATRFLASPLVTDSFKDLAEVVRTGGPPAGKPIIDSENSLWVDFALGMAPIMHAVAEMTEKLVHTDSEIKVLDVAAGHGLFGIAIGRNNPKAKIVALDRSPVLKVAQQNADRSGVSDRFATLPGDALEVSYGNGFNVVLAANLLHHWDRATIHFFLTKVHDALAPGGRVVVVEFAPNEDRVSPPIPASFVLNMLANTEGGDTYTVSEYVSMLSAAGFSACEADALLPTPQTAIIAVKPIK